MTVPGMAVGRMPVCCVARHPALVLHGAQGTGKSILFETIMRAIYGVYMDVIGQYELDRRFTGWASQAASTHAPSPSRSRACPRGPAPGSPRSPRIACVALVFTLGG